MRNIRIFSVITLCLILMLVFSGCNNSKKYDDTAVVLATSTENLATSDNAENTESELPSYTREDDELEIMTQTNSESTDSVAQTDAIPDISETEPNVQETTISKIELPFVPYE